MPIFYTKYNYYAICKIWIHYPLSQKGLCLVGQPQQVYNCPNQKGFFLARESYRILPILK